VFSALIHFNFPRTSFSLNNRRKYSAAHGEFLLRNEGSFEAEFFKNLVLYRTSPA